MSTKALALAMNLAERGVPWRNGGALCPLCGHRLRTTSSGQRGCRPRVRYHKCRNPACLMMLLDLSIKSVEG